MTERRPRIAIVTTTWGDDSDAAQITRLTAGALAIHGDVEIVHLRDVAVPSVTNESVFVVHSTPLIGAQPVRAAIALAATTVHDANRIPAAVVGLLERWEGSAPGVPETLARIAPEIVVLVGSSQPFDLDALDHLGANRPRVIAIPMIGSAGSAPSPRLSAVVEASDVVGSIQPGEERFLRIHFGTSSEIVPLDVALPLNRSATNQGLFGVGWFGRYAVMIRRFPADGPRYARSVTHDVMRGALGRIAVAEVDGNLWRISDEKNTAELPVNPTRVNLWRLMANGIMTIDLRPPDLFGREPVESMMLGTPVIVPDGSAAMEHVAAADGGLWYRNLGEVLDSAHALIDGRTRTRLSAQGRDYAERHHGDMDAFVARTAALIGR